MRISRFSIVVAVKDESEISRSSFLSYYALNPDELIVCLDESADQHELDAVRRLSAQLRWSNRTQIVKVRRNRNFSSYIAWKRRRGFLLASNDRILSVDPDLVLNRHVLKALREVGENDVGYVSCPAIYPVRSLGQFGRAFIHCVVTEFRPPPLTGLYALWRPYWLDSEDEGIEGFQDPLERDAHGSMVVVGEDTYLLNCMRRKHRALHSREMAAYSTKPYHNVAAYSQYELGRYYAATNYPFWNIYFRSAALLQPYLLTGYVYQQESNLKFPRTILKHTHLRRNNFLHISNSCGVKLVSLQVA